MGHELIVWAEMIMETRTCRDVGVLRQYDTCHIELSSMFQKHLSVKGYCCHHVFDKLTALHPT